MHEIDLRAIDLNLLVTFDVLMTERNVTRAAERLARSQSAVSHALARLREQVSDPLLVKLGGRMTPSPFAERLFEDVRPILRSIQRVLSPPQPFDPPTSTRAFRIATSDLVPALFPRLMAAVGRDAPGVSVDWVPVGQQSLLAVSEGQIDVAFVASDLALPEGLARQDAGNVEWGTFARAGHPAVATWGAAAWARWPHVQVLVDDKVKGPLIAAAQVAARKRHVAARVLNFAAVAPLLAQTDFLATLPHVAMYEALERYDLCALPPPFPVPPMPHRFIWSERLGNDPASRWLRTLVMQCFAEVLKGSESSRKKALPPRKRRVKN
ncbi:MAG TPA: LysR family transcriptional regulator [Polyangiaceae bacterium]|nr:LysR family transcriptional regulator [Polyangiaceae bacterium]